MSLFLSIIVPAYNEERRIGRTLDDILGFLKERQYKAEVVVVNDGSRDGTPQQVTSRVDAYSQAGFDLRLLTNDPNRGKGYSVKRGITEARGEIALFTDADLSSPITEAPKLIDPIAQDQADLTFGSRALNRELIGVRQPLFRDLGGRVFNLLMRSITGLRFKDTQCGFKAFRRELALPVLRLQTIEGFGFDPEVLYIARKRGLRLLEVPVAWNDSPDSRVRYLRDSAKMFGDLILIRVNDLAGRYTERSTDASLEGSRPPESARR